MRKKDRSREKFFTISQLSKEFEVSTRTIRYYEEIGLLSPMRTPTNQRLYTKRDRTRLKLILRGKRLGFSLEEIREMLDMYEVSEPEQIRLTIKYGERKIREIEEKIRDLETLKSDIISLKETLLKRLEEIEKQR